MPAWPNGMNKHHFLRMPINRQPTPARIQMNFEGDSLSAKPTRPIVVVDIRTKGPTKANMELTVNAFCTSFNLSIIMAAINSILPDIILSIAMLKAALSIPVPPKRDERMTSTYQFDLMSAYLYVCDICMRIMLVTCLIDRRTLSKSLRLDIT